MPITAPNLEKKAFLQRYDLQLNLRSKDGTSCSEWEAVTNLLSQMQEIDKMIAVWPWVAMDQHHHPPIAINTTACTFFDFQIYIPGLASMNANLRTHLVLGDLRHPSILLRSLVPPAQLVEKLGPWLSATKQGMWSCQLPLAEQITCIGWLLYSAPEYDLSLLHQQIKKDTGIDAALRFHSISTDGSSPADGTKPWTKAIHLEVNASILPSQLKRLERVCTPGAKTFPLGIKMQLVSAHSMEMNNAYQSKMSQSLCLQARF